MVYITFYWFGLAFFDRTVYDCRSLFCCFVPVTGANISTSGWRLSEDARVVCAHVCNFDISWRTLYFLHVQWNRDIKKITSVVICDYSLVESLTVQTLATGGKFQILLSKFNKLHTNQWIMHYTEYQLFISTGRSWKLENTDLFHCKLLRRLLDIRKKWWQENGEHGITTVLFTTYLRGQPKRIMCSIFE